MKNKMLYTVLFMMIITTIYAGILAVLNEQTYDRIQQNQLLKDQKAILYIFNISYDASASTEEIQQLYQSNIQTEELSDITLYKSFSSNNQMIGYAFPIKGIGLWGEIEGYLALSQDKEQILGIDFTSHSETPGLGGRITENWFKEQFRNINLQNSSEYISFDSSEGQIDAISGATQTSQAVEKMLNENISKFLNHKEVD